MDGQGSKCRRKIAEIYNCLSRVHEHYRQTDDRQTDGREFTFAKNYNKSSAVTEMGDRLATTGMGRKWGWAAVRGWVPI